jgi:hypothetical protein
MRQLVAFAIAIALPATVPAREAIATPSIDELHVINHLVFATPLKTFRKT